MRLGAAVVAMQVTALVLSTVVFGWPAAVVGLPLLLGTVLVLLTVWAVRRPVQKLQERRATRWEQESPASGGLMSGSSNFPPRAPDPSPRSGILSAC